MDVPERLHNNGVGMECVPDVPSTGARQRSGGKAPLPHGMGSWWRRGRVECDGLSKRLETFDEASGLDLGVAPGQVVWTEVIVCVIGREHVAGHEQDE
jgi:hypothetical protein